MKHEGWSKSRDINYYYLDGKEKGLTYSEMRNKLTYLGSEMEAYGDRHLFVDEDGNYWEEYFSIGD